ncbi:AAA family ATPase [Paracrocinitomix mangrovi]|uniref:AAA family ATPase n=1 Tax=Paracrocinitomix mangrovi TaxID=2862509 RepID=UPI001C8DACF6|nr:AAA family ATPase [Paracrocinitomix mangrovi]UKN03705.1 AAA family ATPase [Paracrocinitomix mangrovi]
MYFILYGCCASLNGNYQMRIKSFKITEFKPIKNIEISDLGDIVIIAGANGSGKTRLKQAIVSTLQGNPQMDMLIEATRPEEEEEKYFNAANIEVKQGEQNPVLANYVQSRRYGAGRYVGSLVQIDSNRSIQTLKYNAVNWLGGDPDDTVSPINFYFNPFSNRWQDFVNYIHQKAAARDKKLADELKKEPSKGEEIIQKNPDPFLKYQQIFAELLPGKTLLDIDPAQPKEFQYTDVDNQTLPFNSLSSGEQEVIKVLFDVARKEIRHSIIIVDEPELHLHPTLTFKLIESLKAIGEHTNQFIFLTHSADLISTYFSTGNVYFIDSEQTGANQAHRLSDLNHSHNQIVNLIGQNLGLFAVGKKLVFVEGEGSSIDRLAYHLIAQSVDPEIKIVPIGSVINIMTLKNIEEQIRNSIFGINIFMIRDRDGLTPDQIARIEENGKVKCLSRRHIENYFLDSEVLYKVAEQLYLTRNTPNLSAEHIENEIKRIAEESVKFNLLKNSKEHLGQNYHFTIPTVRNIDNKSMEEIKQELKDGIQNNISTLSNDLSLENMTEWLNQEETKLTSMIESEEWKDNYQGKIIFSRMCSEVLKGDPLRIKHAYIDIALKEKPEAVQDLIDIFSGI